MLSEILKNLFPFEPSRNLFYFGIEILPWIYLIGVIVVAVMLFWSKEKPFSIVFFIVPSAITSLIVPFDIVIYHFGNHVEILNTLIDFLGLIAPYLLVLSMILALSGIIETIFRKLYKKSLVISILALFCSFLFYLVLVMYAFSACV